MCAGGSQSSTRRSSTRRFATTKRPSARTGSTPATSPSGSGITRGQKKRDNRFYKKQFREYAAFDSNSIAYENSIEIEGSRENRQKAIDIISKDNGNGGTRDENNREYGGHFTKEGVREVEAGPFAKPGDKYVSVTLLFPNHTFHSHPSGDNTGGFLQFPSKTDLDNTGETISYVFGRGNNTTYIFNSSGVLATIPTSRFVDFKRPKK